VQVYYAKFPVDMEERYVILMDPLLGTYGQAGHIGQWNEPAMR
jgi:uracil phosphoribosyltransferase